MHRFHTTIAGHRRFLAGLAFILMFSGQLQAETHWPRFRGADGSGHSAEKTIPTKWGADDVVWRTELPGRGHSSPCLWDEMIFLTSAREKEGRVERLVICLRRDTGKILWQKATPIGEAEKVHDMNGFATPTCATDGERVMAFFGRGGVHCYDLDGKSIWSRDFGEFPGSWGTGASPIILEEKVIQNCDSASPGKSFLIAMDKTTGKTIWKIERPGMPRGGWSTPILIDTESRKELILHGEHGLRGYDPMSGKELWFCKGFNGRGTPSPVLGHKLLFVVSGKPGDTYAVRPGGSGDVTSTHMAWHTPRKKGRNVSSPILVENYLLCASLQGNVDCYDAITGKQLWNERLDAAYSASPIAVSGLVYFLDETGKTAVVKPGNKLEVIAQNDIGDRDGEIFRGSPVAAEGQILVRSDRAIYCIGK